MNNLNKLYAHLTAFEMVSATMLKLRQYGLRSEMININTVEKVMFSVLNDMMKKGGETNEESTGVSKLRKQGNTNEQRGTRVCQMRVYGKRQKTV